MQREISSFPLPAELKGKLLSAGFTTVEDLHDVKPTELSQELSISKEEALNLLRVIKGEKGTLNDEGTSVSTSSKKSGVIQEKSQSALDMLKNESNFQNIITFCEKLDAMLDGGVPVKKITEFCGAPGVGKTQICLQLCVDVQIPETFGGLGGEAVYIDTEGSFLVDRLSDMATATVKHCQQLAAMQSCQDSQEAMKNFTHDSILNGVHYMRSHSYVDLIAAVHILPDFIAAHPKVKLVVIDSIAFHFRHDFDDLSLRTRLLNGMAQNLIRLANKQSLAVVLTNQMTTKFNMDSSSTGPSQNLIPALGESWGHAATIRIILYWQNQQRWALLYKSPSHEEITVPYLVTTAGVRDIAEEDHSSTGAADENDNVQLAKRRRTDPAS